MAKKKEKAWHPTATGPMQFMKILNIEWHCPTKSKTKLYDINILEEINTGEILLNIYERGNPVIIGTKMVGRNVGISTLHKEIRQSFKAWLNEEQDIFEFKHLGDAKVKYPKIQEGAEISEKQEEVKIRRVPVKDRKESTNDTEKFNEPEKKPKRKAKAKTKKEEPKDEVKPKPNKKVTKKSTTKSKSTKVSKKTDKTSSTKSSKTIASKKSVPKKSTNSNRKKTSNKKAAKKELF